jgi:hypothetical protein
MDLLAVFGGMLHHVVEKVAICMTFRMDGISARGRLPPAFAAAPAYFSGWPYV